MSDVRVKELGFGWFRKAGGRQFSEVCFRAGAMSLGKRVVEDKPHSPVSRVMVTPPKTKRKQVYYHWGTYTALLYLNRLCEIWERRWKSYLDDIYLLLDTSRADLGDSLHGEHEEKHGFGKPEMTMVQSVPKLLLGDISTDQARLVGRFGQSPSPGKGSRLGTRSSTFFNAPLRAFFALAMM